MEPSEEIRRNVERWLVAAREGDVEAYNAKISDHPGALMIGTDGEEWWHSADAAVWTRQVEETGGFPLGWGEIEAWEEGTVGWAAAKLTITGPDQVFPVRLTCVLHLEKGEWKLVHLHFSSGRPNLELLGRELPVSLDQIERTIMRERPDLTDTLAADGTVTIVFTDIVDSTVLTARLGDHSWLDVLRRHNELIRDTAALHHGIVVETQGDGSMLAFSSARRAVACAKAIQSELERTFAAAPAPIRVRIGIHTGDALHEADHFYGTTVHFAARVASNALGGEVLVSNLVRELVAGSGVSFRQSREVELKGLEGSHQLFAVDLG